MDLERALVSKIASTGKLEDAISRGIRADHFVDDEARGVYLHMIDHAREYGSAPSLTALKEDQPSFEWVHIQEPLEYICDKFTNNVRRRLAAEYVQDLAGMVDDPEQAEKLDLRFMEVSRRLATAVPSISVARFSDMDKRIAEYDKLRKEGKRVGIPFGFPSLDEWTGGIQPHEFVTVTGFSGLGKSTLLKVVAFNQYVNGLTPLYISLEEESKAILRKFDAMAAVLDYAKLKQLDLTEEEIANWQETAAKVRKRTHDIPIIDKIRHCTPDHVYAETVRHKPDIVIVDYLSLMRSSSPQRGVSMWQSLTEITQDLKQNARTLGIPILAAAQTNRSGKDGAALDNTGYSISIVQDSDIVIGLQQDEEQRDEREMVIKLMKNRDGRLGEFASRWDHESMTFRQITLQDKFGRPGSK